MRLFLACVSSVGDEAKLHTDSEPVPACVREDEPEHSGSHGAEPSLSWASAGSPLPVVTLAPQLCLERSAFHLISFTSHLQISLPATILQVGVWKDWKTQSTKQVLQGKLGRGCLSHPVEGGPSGGQETHGSS